MPDEQQPSASPDDKTLMRRLAAGDIESLGELFVRHGKYVESAIWRFSPHLTRSEVEDLAQDVFLRVNQLAGGYREQHWFRAWIYKVAVQMARNARRNKSLRANLLRQSGFLYLGIGAAIDDSPENRSAIKETLVKAMDKLPKSQWEILLLFEVEGFSAAEIGDILELSPQAVWTRLSRARTRLFDIASRMTGEGMPQELPVPVRGRS